MKGGTRVAAGVAAGYLMGRTKKMRLALMIAAAGMTGAGYPMGDPLGAPLGVGGSAGA